MPPLTMKTNPAFLTERELIESFVVRRADFDLVMQVVRENTGDSNQHALVVGPRGIGKTTLALRVVAEVRRDPELSNCWYPIVFAEESYQVTTPGEFWLEALFHLARQTDSPVWRSVHADLEKETAEERLRERALAQLMDFADSQSKRLILVVENLNMLLGQQLSEEDAWVLRHTLMNERRVMLLASATQRFDEVENYGKALFELFRIFDLKPLDVRECAIIWEAITGNAVSDFRIRPIEVLTGGNPRLIRIIALFESRKSLRELLTDLTRLVDDHTEYFKSYLDALAPSERKVFVSLAEIWEPADAREVATVARLDVSKTSAFLTRLVERGAVTVVARHGRKNNYQVAERMYNIYYLMRRRGRPSSRVRAAVNFIIGMYEPAELAAVAEELLREACEIHSEERRDYYSALDTLMKEIPDPETRRRIVQTAPPSLLADIEKDGYHRTWVADSGTREPFGATEIGMEEQELLRAMREFGGDLQEASELERKCREVLESQPNVAVYWIHLGDLLAAIPTRVTDAEQAYRKGIEIDANDAWTWMQLGSLLDEKLDRYEEAEQAYRRAIEIDINSTWAWMQLGTLLGDKLGRYDEAEQAYRRAIKADANSTWAWVGLGTLLGGKLDRYEEAEQAYRRAIEIDVNSAWAWMRLGTLLDDKLDRYEEAEQAYRKAIEIDVNSTWAWMRLGTLLDEKLERYEDAEQAYRKAIEIDANTTWAWMQLGTLLDEKLERCEEAERVYQKIIEMDANNTWSWARLGRLLHTKLERYDEAERAYRNAIECDAKNAWAWAHLGLLLHVQLGRYDEAEQAYKDAIQLEPGVALGWALLGSLLHEKQGRYEEAKVAYQKAIELDRTGNLWRSDMVDLLHFGLGQTDRAIEFAAESAANAPGNANLLNSLAWAFYKINDARTLIRAEQWARQAVALEADNSVFRHTLACILCALERPGEAVEHAAIYLADTNAVRLTPVDAITLIVELAAAGLSRAALELAKESPSAPFIEPLIVGLQLHVGDSVKAPMEIVEVAKDIVKQIEDRKTQVSSAK